MSYTTPPTTFTQSGTALAVADSTPTTITFPTAFASAPRVQATLTGERLAGVTAFKIDTITATGFNVTFALSIADPRDVSWIAHGVVP